MRKKTITKKTTRVPKTRGAGTYTEAQFWQMIRSALRNRSRYWKPISLCKQAAKRKYEGTNRRQKFEYRCNVCGLYVPEKFIQVDHVIPTGSLQSASDLPRFVETLFCELDNLQTICVGCHSLKTERERNDNN